MGKLSCAYFPVCSGCQIQGEIAPPPVWSELQLFFKAIAPELEVPLEMGAVTGWRSRAKLAVRGKSHSVEIGLYKRGTHDVVSIPDCPLHHSAINQIIAKAVSLIALEKIAPYCEASRSGTLRYLQLSVERKSRKVQLVLVVNTSSIDSSLIRFVNQLYKEEEVHSIWVNFQPESTNRIFGEEWVLCAGERYLWERLGRVDCAFHPACFSQANLSLFDQTLDQINSYVKPGSKVVELYSGVGVIGLNLASEGCYVQCVEINSFASECFELSRAQLPQPLQKNISLCVAASENVDSLLQGNQAVVVDPPRKGLEASLIEAICSVPEIKQLVYLSCGPRSFQRDVQMFIKRGWKMDQARGYLFFPGTDHVEVLCNLKR